MTHVQRIAVSVERPKRSEQFELHAGVLRIGSAAYCDIRLAPDEAAPEQVMLQGHDRGLLVRRLNGEFPMLLDGRELTEAVVTADARLEISGVKLAIRLLAPKQQGQNTRSVLKRVRQFALLVALAVMAYAVLRGEPEERAFDHSLPTPVLFAGQELPKCRYEDNGLARAFAWEQLAAAESKRERYPYNTGEGVAAVHLYDSAESCFRAARDRAAADEARRVRTQIVQTLQEDLRAHQVRLEWALERHRYPAAIGEVQEIEALLIGRTDLHAQWIAAVARDLRAMANQRTETKDAPGFKL